MVHCIPVLKKRLKNNENQIEGCTYKHEGHSVQDDAIEPNDVFVINGMHDCSLLEKLHGVILHLLLAQALDGHLDL